MRTLTLERGYSSSFSDSDEARLFMDWFHELPNADGKYHEEERVEICACGISDYVTIDDRVRYITIVASDRETPECFNIRKDGRITEVSNYLDCDFQKWLCISYQKGCRFIQLEIGK